MKYGGALPSQMLAELVSGGFIDGVDKQHIRPGSLDLPVLADGFRVNGAFLPYYDEDVEQAIKRSSGSLIKAGSVLERGSCYVFPSTAKINKLLENVYSFSNPKSSSGRVDLHVRLLANRVSRYDCIPEKYKGRLWVMVIPKSFPVITFDGVTLYQLRFFNQDTRFDELRLELAFNNSGGFIFDKIGRKVEYQDVIHSDKDGSILLTLGLEYSIPGFEAIETKEPIDLSKNDYYDPEVFFRPIVLPNHSLTLRDNAFYILSTKEYVRVPPHLACEMRPMDERSGDIRSHYAGFIDPGWGVAEEGDGKGRPLTLEVRSFDSGLIVRHGQPIAKIRLERMIQLPPEHYDQMSPTYGGQFGPKLGKYFKKWR
jgi:dCTP deaminase